MRELNIVLEGIADRLDFPGSIGGYVYAQLGLELDNQLDQLSRLDGQIVQKVRLGRQGRLGDAE